MCSCFWSADNTVGRIRTLADSRYLFPLPKYNYLGCHVACPFWVLNRAPFFSVSLAIYLWHCCICVRLIEYAFYSSNSRFITGKLATFHFTTLRVSPVHLPNSIAFDVGFILRFSGVSALLSIAIYRECTIYSVFRSPYEKNCAF